MSACDLITSEIIHVRHASPEGKAGSPVAHRLVRKGLSVWIDLDRLDDAAKQSALFSIGRFNLLSFDERDYGPNFHEKKLVTPLCRYAREVIAEVLPDVEIASVRLLTFPRILGVAFNPISVYLLNDGMRDVAVIYEVRNTFGDMHSYVGIIQKDNTTTHKVKKKLHVSPFFSMDGGYQLKIRDGGDDLSLVIHYHNKDVPLLTATLRGDKQRLSASSILKGFAKTRVFPMRPLISIHMEALKLWFKKVPFFGRPKPDPSSWTLAKASTTQKD